MAMRCSQMQQTHAKPCSQRLSSGYLLMQQCWQVTVGHLIESSATLTKCLSSLTHALNRESSKSQKVVTQCKIASNSHENMNIMLHDLFGADHVPDYVKCLKAALDDSKTRHYTKPTGLVWKRLEARYMQHKALLSSARESAVSLNNLLLVPAN